MSITAGNRIKIVGRHEDGERTLLIVPVENSSCFKLRWDIGGSIAQEFSGLYSTLSSAMHAGNKYIRRSIDGRPDYGTYTAKVIKDKKAKGVYAPTVSEEEEH